MEDEHNPEVCDKLVNSQMTLVETQSYKCEICLQEFPNLHKLTNHERIHTKEKPFKCKQCGKCYKESRTLKYHMKLHTGCLNTDCRFYILQY